MKNKFILLCGLLVATTLCFSACDNDDDDKDDDSGISGKPEMVGNLYAEPCLDFLAEPGEIKTFMAGYELLNETEEALIFNGKYKEEITMYNFEGGFLENVGVAFDENVSQNDLHKALKNKYKYEREETGAGTAIKLYSHPKKEVVIGLMENMTNGVVINVIVYLDTHDYSSKPALHGNSSHPTVSPADRIVAAANRVADSLR